MHERGVSKYVVKGGVLLQQAKKVWKVTEVYSTHFIAELVIPKPERVMVCSFTYTDLPSFQEPNESLLGEYEKTWGLQSARR